MQETPTEMCPDEPAVPEETDSDSSWYSRALEQAWGLFAKLVENQGKTALYRQDIREFPRFSRDLFGTSRMLDTDILKIIGSLWSSRESPYGHDILVALAAGENGPSEAFATFLRHMLATYGLTSQIQTIMLDPYCMANHGPRDMTGEEMFPHKRGRWLLRSLDHIQQIHTLSPEALRVLVDTCGIRAFYLYPPDVLLTTGESFLCEDKPGYFIFSRPTREESYGAQVPDGTMNMSESFFSPEDGKPNFKQWLSAFRAVGRIPIILEGETAEDLFSRIAKVIGQMKGNSPTALNSNPMCVVIDCHGGRSLFGMHSSRHHDLFRAEHMDQNTSRELGEALAGAPLLFTGCNLGQAHAGESSSAAMMARALQTRVYAFDGHSFGPKRIEILPGDNGGHRFTMTTYDRGTNRTLEALCFDPPTGP